jgi:hypothetical protein
MPKVFVEPRPKGRPEGSAIAVTSSRSRHLPRPEEAMIAASDHFVILINKPTQLSGASVSALPGESHSVQYHPR